jgi:hypothetical protein
MDRLPKELVDCISQYLGPYDLRSTLVLSCKFQHAAEDSCGAYTTYSLTKDNGARFVAYRRTRQVKYSRDIILGLDCLHWTISIKRILATTQRKSLER